MGVKNRILQINELMQRELGAILLRGVDFPENTIATITRVNASPNLQQAKVYISVMPEGKTKEVLKTLQRDIYAIQQQLNKRLKMRPVPKIKWVWETQTAEAQKIEQLLDEIKNGG